MAKGKIVAMGGGSSHVKDLIKLSGKEFPNVLMLPTAFFEEDIDRSVAEAFFNYGCDVEPLYLTYPGMTEEIVKTKIENADVIYVSGGNLRFLMTTWKKHKADIYLKKAFEDGKVLAGTSSGAMCWFKEGYDDCGPDHAFMFVECLGLLPFSNAPHFESGEWGSYQDALKGRNLSAIACENGSAFCFDGENYFTYQDNPYRSVYYYDATDNFKKHNLMEEKDLLKNLK